MKKQLFYFSIFICVLMPFVATADFSVDLSRPEDPFNITTLESITFTVEVQEDGNPVSGQTVTFSVEPDDGIASVSPTSGTTDTNGQVQTTLSLAGDSLESHYTVTASLDNGEGNVPSESVPVGRVSDGAELILYINHLRPYSQGESVAFTFSLRKDGRGVSDRRVTFSVSPDNGTASVSPTSATTDTNGSARTALILGNDASGAYSVTATLDDGISVSNGIGSVNYPNKPPGFISMLVRSGALPLNPGKSRTFTAIVEKDGNYISDRTVTFSVSPDDGTVSLSPTTATTGSDGRASTSLITGSGSSGTYTVTATLDNGQSISGTSTVEASSSPSPAVQQIRFVPPTDPVSEQQVSEKGQQDDTNTGDQNSETGQQDNTDPNQQQTETTTQQDTNTQDPQTGQQDSETGQQDDTDTSEENSQTGQQDDTDPNQQQTETTTQQNTNTQDPQTGQQDSETGQQDDTDTSEENSQTGQQDEVQQPKSEADPEPEPNYTIIPFNYDREGVGKVVFSELMLAGSEKYPQWIELYNTTDQDIDINGWKIVGRYLDDSNAINILESQVISKSFTIKGKETALIVSFATPNSMDRISRGLADKTYALESNPKNFWNYKGLVLELQDAEGNPIDRIGNLNEENEIVWKIPISVRNRRISLIRRLKTTLTREYNFTSGIKEFGWFPAEKAKRLIGNKSQYYYGRDSDIGSPGYRIENGETLPVSLSSFSSQLNKNGQIILSWVTESQIDNAGFNILRSQSKQGPFAQVNPKLLQGAGTTGKRSSYKWIDATAKPDVVYYYRIEDVSFAGIRNQLATVRTRGHVSASEMYITQWGSLKKRN